MKRGSRELLFVASILAASTVNCGGDKKGGNGDGGQPEGGGSPATGGTAGHGGNGAGNPGTGGSAGVAGKGGMSGIGGSAGQAGGGEAGTAGSGGAAGADGGRVDASTDSGRVDASMDGGRVDASADGGNFDAGMDGGSLDAGGPSFDPGTDCITPKGETPLDAATEGLPASGLVLWLRGDHGVHKTAANAVCSWVDQSAHGWIFTPYSERPSWSATGLGGLPAVRSTIAGEGLAINSVLGIGPTSPRTIIAVSQLVSATQRFHAVFQGRATSAGTYLGLDTNTFNTAGSREGVYMMDNGFDSELATTTAAPRVHVYIIKMMTVNQPILDNVEYRVNGTSLTLTPRPTGGNGKFEDFSTADYTSVVSSAEGLVAEAIIYDHALSGSELTAVEGALMARYGIQ